MIRGDQKWYFRFYMQFWAREAQFRRPYPALAGKGWAREAQFRRPYPALAGKG